MRYMVGFYSVWMDVWETEQAQLKCFANNGTLRRPLVLSEKNNAPIAQKPRAREVPSRYKAARTTLPSQPAGKACVTPRRCLSPNSSRTAPTTPAQSATKRAQSAERRRPTTPSSPPSSRPSTPAHDSQAAMHISSSKRVIGGRASSDILWPSTRSLSVSFQSDTYSLPMVKREKPALKPVANAAHKSAESPVASRKATPERKKTPLRGRNSLDQLENSKPVETPHSRMVDLQWWPSRTAGKFPPNSLANSVDLANKSRTTAASQLLGRGVSPVRTPVSDAVSKISLKPATVVARTRRASFDGSNRENGVIAIQSIRDDSLFASGAWAIASGVGFSLNSSCGTPTVTQPSRTQTMLNLALQRPPSPNKGTLSSSSSSSSRGAISPSRTRTSTLFPSSSSIGRSMSVLSFIADVRRGKNCANHIEDAHQLRLLHNRYLQWRFGNARADTALSIQKVTAENILYNVWLTTSKLRDSVTAKRMNLQQLMLERKLALVLKEQMAFLDDWALVETEHSSSLPRVIEALEASTLRVPVSGGARADLNTMKIAVSSAVDVLLAMASSICSLSKVEKMNDLVSELANVAAQERAMLIECEDLLASAVAMQVEEASLRTHLIQLKQAMHEEKQPL